MPPLPSTHIVPPSHKRYLTQCHLSHHHTPRTHPCPSHTHPILPLPTHPPTHSPLPPLGWSCPPQALSDLTTRSHQVLLLPLLAVARGWRAVLAPQPPAAPLVTLLNSLCDRLQQQWTAFSSNQLAAVEQYEGRSKMGLQQGEGGAKRGGGGGWRQWGAVGWEGVCWWVHGEEWGNIHSRPMGRT